MANGNVARAEDVDDLAHHVQFLSTAGTTPAVSHRPADREHQANRWP